MRGAALALAAAVTACRTNRTAPSNQSASIPASSALPPATARPTETSEPDQAVIPAPRTERPPISRAGYLDGMIRPDESGHGFVVHGTDDAFVPIGCNYFDPHTGWAPRIWEQYDHERVARHLDLIASAGFTAIRVFMDMSTLTPLFEYYAEKGFAKLDDMVRTAGQAGLRLILSGPNNWQGTPAHLAGDRYTDPRIIGYLNDLWRELGRRYGAEKTILSWDLLNEPSLFWPDFNAAVLDRWQTYAKQVTGKAVSDRLPAYTVGGQDRDVWLAYLRFQESLAEDWVHGQVSALREAGARQMISVGLVQWSVPVFLPLGVSYPCFNPRLIAPFLDYTSVHFYPMLSQPDLDREIDLQRAYLQTVVRGAHVEGKPLILEEFGWKGGKQVPNDTTTWPQAQQTRWGETVLFATRNVCSGWLNWAFADAAAPNADLSAASGLWTEDEKIKQWGSVFSMHAARLKAAPPVFKPALVSWPLDLYSHLYDNDGHPPMEWLAGRLAAQPSDDIEIAFY